MTSALKVSAGTVREKGHFRICETLAPEEFQEGLSGQAVLLGPLSVELDFSWKGGRPAVRGFVSGRWELECCRCLERRGLAYRAKVEGTFTATQEAIDAAEEVRQALVLALPMKAYCKPDCKGLCLSCGGNRNVAECGCA